MLRELIAAILAFGVVAALDQVAMHRGLQPPGFRDPLRRLAAGFGLAGIFYLGVFYPLVSFDQPRDLDFESLSHFGIFFFQLLLGASLIAWYACGFIAVAGARHAASAWVRLFGLQAASIGRELAIGLVAGAVAWFGVLTAALALGLLITAISGEEALAQQPSELIVWMAGLPVVLRLGISLSAGVVEEIFFRGFLQPRLGIAASTGLFVCAHLAYGQPILLVGVTLLSLFYARLVAWRGNVWAAMTAHFLFDAVQLLVIIPGVLRIRDGGAIDRLVSLWL